MTITMLNFILLGLMLLTGGIVACQRQAFAAVFLMGIISLLSVLVFVCLDAVDVAFTEAAVGAGISTLLFLGALYATNSPLFPSAQAPTLSRRHCVPAFLLVTLTGVLLLVGIQDIPAFSDVDAPVHKHISPRYIIDTATEIGVPNMVTAVLASYRGYDTLGEVTVVFTAGIGVLLLLGYTATQQAAPINLTQHVIERLVSRLVIPLVLLFALYVQFHGDYSPGGGFQAGVLFAAGFIIYGLIFGMQRLHAVACPGIIQRLAAGGVLLYAGVGVASLLSGGDFLDYSVLADVRTDGQHLGIFFVELGVGMTVFATMLGMFSAFNHE